MSSGLQEILCCMGHPVAGYPIQFVIEKALAAAGLDWRFLTLDIAPAQLADAVRGMKAMGFRGGHITSPHKEAIVPFLDELTPDAKRVGSVNCVYREGDRLMGDNTEGKGLLAALRPDFDPAGKSVLLLGAGSSARAMALELARSGVTEIVVVDRSEEPAAALCQMLKEHASVPSRCVIAAEEITLPDDTGLIVNAVDTGSITGQTRLSIRPNSLRAGVVVADILLGSLRTTLLRHAAEKGCRVSSGAHIYVRQTEISYVRWTGRDPNINTMQDALEEFLEI